MQTARPELTIVSGASANHATCLGNLLRSLHLCGVRARTVMYDLGLEEAQAQVLRGQCDELRKFPFDRYPDWVDIRVKRGQYAWKPIIVAEVAAEAQGPVLWLDAGDLVYGDLAPVTKILREQGFYSPTSDGDLGKWTHPRTLEYLQVASDLLHKANRNGAIVGVNPCRPGISALVRAWQRCALTRDCIAPPGSSRKNHRQDQAVLSVLAYQFQRAFGIVLVSRKLEIGTQNDRLPPDQVEARIRYYRAFARRVRVRIMLSRAKRAPGRIARRVARAAPRANVERVARGVARRVRAAARRVAALSGRIRATLAAPTRRSHGALPSPRSTPAAGQLRVAMVAHGSLPIPPTGWGATERVIWNHHLHHERLGVASTVVNTRNPGEILAQLRAFAPDVIHLHAELQMDALAPYLAQRPTPLVFTSHDRRVAEWLPPLARSAARAADVIIALSPAIAEHFARKGFSRVTYIPNGVDPAVFRPLHKQRNTVIAVGRNVPAKRLAEIARFFLSRPDYQLTICGPGTTEPDWKHGTIPTGPNVIALGNVSQAEVARRLGESEFFVHLSGSEASSLAVREAMAAGCRVWTAPYNAQDLENVALFWEEAVGDPELGARARQEAVERLDWSTVVARTVEVYREALARHGRRP